MSLYSNNVNDVFEFDSPMNKYNYYVIPVAHMAYGSGSLPLYLYNTTVRVNFKIDDNNDPVHSGGKVWTHMAGQNSVVYSNGTVCISS